MTFAPAVPVRSIRIAAVRSDYMIRDNGEYYRQIDKAADYIKSCIAGLFESSPSILIVLGSGLGPLTDSCSIVKEIKYSDIPGFPVSTAPGHAGKLIAGRLADRNVFMMNGRFHYYEGYSLDEVTFYVRVMGVIGVKTMLLTNAAGGICEDMVPPELVAVEDHLSFFAEPALRGPNPDRFGVRFPDQSFVYDREYLDIMDRVAKERGINLKRGVYAYSKGPQYETPAEIRALRTLGASCVGMSTVPEAITASHMGIRVAAFSCITNMAAGMSSNKLSEAEVLAMASEASGESCSLVEGFIASI